MEYHEYVWIKSKAMFDSLFTHMSGENRAHYDISEEGELTLIEVSGKPKQKFTDYQRKIINNLKLRAEYVEFEEVQC